MAELQHFQTSQRLDIVLFFFFGLPEGPLDAAGEGRAYNGLWPYSPGGLPDVAEFGSPRSRDRCPSGCISCLLERTLQFHTHPVRGVGGLEARC